MCVHILYIISSTKNTLDAVRLKLEWYLTYTYVYITRVFTKLYATSRCKPYFKYTHTHTYCVTRLTSAAYMHAGKTVPEEDLKALLEEDMSEEAVQEEKETEIMLDCNEKFNEVWVCFLVHTV